MSDAHTFVAMLRGPAWCFCKESGCEGWRAYVAQHKDLLDGEPTDDDIALDKAVISARDATVRRYQALFGPTVDFATALELYAADMTADQAITD
jgi:hypothetical protein